MLKNLLGWFVDFWKKNQKKLLDSLKAAARYLLFAWASTIVASLMAEPNLTPVMFATLTAVDKWIHENWKESGTGLRGISPL